jgi:hypothetical protein
MGSPVTAGMPLRTARRHPMNHVTEAAVLASIQSVVAPNTGKDFVAGKQVKSLPLQGDDVVFDVELADTATTPILVLRRARFDAVPSSRAWPTPASAPQRASSPMRWGAACSCCPGVKYKLVGYPPGAP